MVFPNNKDDMLKISLESIRYPNYYLAFDDNGFSIYDWRTRKFDADVKEFVNNATFIIKQGLVDHTLVMDPEINLAATLIRLSHV